MIWGSTMAAMIIEAGATARAAFDVNIEYPFE
jgi:hypothetical protein